MGTGLLCQSLYLYDRKTNRFYVRERFGWMCLRIKMCIVMYARCDDATAAPYHKYANWKRRQTSPRRKSVCIQVEDCYNKNNFRQRKVRHGCK